MAEGNIVNIMTSCDDNLAVYIMPQIASIGVNLKGYDVNFYLFHSRVRPGNVQMIRDYCGTFGNIVFHEVFIADTSFYEKLAQYGGTWPHEAYFYLLCHEHLPKDAERVLYIDAGDAVFHGDISEYYFGDFEGNSLIGSICRITAADPPQSQTADISDLTRWTSVLENITKGSYDLSASKELVRPFCGGDMQDPEKLEEILAGVLTSGSIVLNLEKMRGVSAGDYSALLEALIECYPERKMIYFGDQGFLSAAFVGDIKYFGYPEIFDMYYIPYNFCIWYIDDGRELGYKPVVLHFAGENKPKPWKARFSLEALEKYRSKSPRKFHVPFFINQKQHALYEIWWEYCAMTPVYAELDEAARISARVLESNFLPLCQWYNELADMYYRDTGNEPPRLKEGENKIG